MHICRLALLTSLVIVAPSSRGAAQESVTPLPRAHAHNDYWHDRPLHEALDRGFCSVEADVFLVDGELLVGHDRQELSPDRSLAALYLDPLKERVAERDGRVQATDSPFFLLVDVKSEAEATYNALHELLAKYDTLVTSVEDGKVHPRAVTVVVSGNRAEDVIRSQRVRYAGIDGRPSDLEKSADREKADSSHVMPWISANWNTLFRWKGEGAMPADERLRLRDYVEKAHRQNRLVRFWATPENEAVWKELLAADVDLIGTDDLAKLQSFLTAAHTARPASKRD